MMGNIKSTIKARIYNNLAPYREYFLNRRVTSEEAQETLEDLIYSESDEVDKMIEELKETGDYDKALAVFVGDDEDFLQDLREIQHDIVDEYKELMIISKQKDKQHGLCINKKWFI